MLFGYYRNTKCMSAVKIFTCLGLESRLSGKHFSKASTYWKRLIPVSDELYPSTASDVVPHSQNYSGTTSSLYLQQHSQRRTSLDNRSVQDFLRPLKNVLSEIFMEYPGDVSLAINLVRRTSDFAD
jgi:hypothetical protein